MGEHGGTLRDEQVLGLQKGEQGSKVGKGSDGEKVGERHGGSHKILVSQPISDPGNRGRGVEVIVEQPGQQIVEGGDKREKLDLFSNDGKGVTRVGVEKIAMNVATDEGVVEHRSVEIMEVESVG